MASVTTTTKTDDFDKAENATTYQFATRTTGGGVQWFEIDLAGKNESKFLDFLNKHIEGGRAVATPEPVTKRKSSGAGTRNRDYTRAVRDWATQQGIEISARGRLSSEVIAQYEASRAA